MNVLTLYFKDKVYDAAHEIPEGKKAGDKVVSSVPVLDWGVEGGALIGVLSPNMISIFPLAELEAGVVVLGAEEAAGEVLPEDSEDASDSPGSGAEIFKPDFSGSGATDGESVGPDEG